MIKNIQSMDSIRSYCMRGTPLPEELRHWLAEALRRYLERDCDTLNEAFGVAQGRGGVPWWREHAIRLRDAALRDMSRQFFADDDVASRVREISQLCNRYASTSWMRDRERREMPHHYRGTPQEHLWVAFRSRAKMPVTERHLRTLLIDETDSLKNGDKPKAGAVGAITEQPCTRARILRSAEES